jgi:hypothetical protein
MGGEDTYGAAFHAGFRKPICLLRNISTLADTLVL